MDCSEINRILDNAKREGKNDNLTSLLTVLAAFQCRAFIPVVNERENLITACEDQLRDDDAAGKVRSDSLVRLLEYFKSI